MRPALVFYSCNWYNSFNGGELISTAETIMKGLDWSYLTNILITIIPALICITLHELAHGYIAYRLGDNTAKEAGRLTLNPIKHIDIMGLAMMVIFKFGWAKPVPVNMMKFKNPKRGMAITAAAGPISNLLISIIFLFLYGLLLVPLYEMGETGSYILQILYLTAYISIALAIFNFIPIPPLDGSKVLYAVLPDKAYLKLMHYERYGMLFLIALLFMLNNLSINPLGIAVSYVLDKLFVVAQWGYDIANNLI